VYLIQFCNRRKLRAQFETLSKRTRLTFSPGETVPMKQVSGELDRFFETGDARFRAPIQFPGTAHQQLVWEALLAMKPGQLMSYSDLAVRVGKPGAARAVAGAVGANRLSIVIPCHRIIGANGHLTGYAGGLPRKRALLELEGLR
ncbi:MAG: methylated-DNA--[protein]-cysteine S-methyltransferase, partial [Verrucomicrobiota bacterium]